MRSSFVAACSIFALGLAFGVQAACGNDDSSVFDGSSGGPDSGTGCAAGSIGCLPGSDGGGACRTPVECAQQEGQNCDGGPGTSISGIVTDPAGKVPIYNATVYIPLSATDPLDTITDGEKTCDRCDAKISGNPIAVTTTDTSGHFTLQNAAFGDLVPLVIQIGKWRRRVDIPNVAKCADTPADASLLHLPRNSGEGHIPKIAITTGGADPLQCLLTKMGIDIKEFGAASGATPGPGRVDMYQGGGAVVNSVNKPASAGFSASAGGASFPPAHGLWSSLPNLQNYDMVLMGCEGDEDEKVATYPNFGKDDSYDSVYNYALNGGRIFMTHYHEVWLRKNTHSEFSSIATFASPDRVPPAVPGDPVTTQVPAYITGTFDKAKAMQDWLQKQNALTALNGGLPEFDARHNVDAVSANGLSWITLTNPNVPAPNSSSVQFMTFNTPVGADASSVCGRVMLSDLHVGSGAQSGVSDDPQATFPDGCKTTDLSAQQKALEFMLFDLSSCIQKDDAPVQGPK
jgi:hypothetical protein